ncbi:MAG: hypothetical protein Q8M93_06390 [Polaromonas sp.]|uniref:hypothetical protein n=1 Tax=Polaromonas sp. TaxID=1869339 RepID=UPI00273056DE|nr:hypothetical protein [Polaromonas sp.]MDP2449490.1 hypothetical protein [Polaromonas sp.]MDP3246578.1 hypothetical protein [Polaromonas sp.]MDP3757240.1 hypothetical protein [Polaromonas sp.]MDP3826199.1 hypothetical protein [Polaromonas sp.]
MALAASSPTDAPGTAGTRQRRTLFGPAVWLVAALVGLGALLAMLPDGTAEPLQTVIAWLMVAVVAALAVMLVAKGMERLLDSESS